MTVNQGPTSEPSEYAYLQPILSQSRILLVAGISLADTPGCFMS